MNSDSLLRRYAADVRSLIPGTAAGVMQLMYPSLGAGVEEHSDFFNEPFERITRSVPQIWATILAPDGAARARGIRDLHRGIGGADTRGRRYHALQPETFWWAHATFTWEIFRSVQFFHPETLTTAEQERLYGETVDWYERYGVSTRPVPPNYVAFQTKFRQICAEDLELTPSAARALHIAQHGGGRVNMVPMAPDRLGRAAGLVLSPPLRVITFGCLPEMVRDRFAIPWTLADNATFTAMATALTHGTRIVPHRLNHWGLRTALRVVGAGTRADRYHPAA
ncbi:oxygenase MpaB family protein [Nocardia sp. NPDC051832]|uniref:oxygenase MpaB family protein n=1 Tax=Nocardia sp. NPDC051832 TaxID=3155673 RepID=UPI00343D9264